MEEVRTNAGQGLGIAGLIMGIIAIPLAILGCTSVLGLILGITGIVLSAVGLSQASKSNGVKGLPTAGLVVSILGTCIAIMWMLFIATAINEGGKWWARDGIPFMEEIKKEIESGIDDGMDNAFEEFGDELEQIGSDLEEKLEDLEYDIEWEESWGEEISNEEFEIVLDVYEDLISDYLELMKLADEGDLDAISGYVKVSVKAAALASKISQISGQLSEEQREKFDALQEKYQDALDEAKEE